MAVSKTIFNLTEEKTSKLAVLIDADNASAKDIENILNELTKYGEATVKRIYGNFVNQNVFDVEERSTGTSDHKNLYVRLKKTK